MEDLEWILVGGSRPETRMTLEIASNYPQNATGSHPSEHLHPIRIAPQPLLVPPGARDLGSVPVEFLVDLALFRCVFADLTMARTYLQM